jgi:sterol desaturase/sphingolipid hydroxylase (fatty acid hydroxylase superfamily)
VVWLTTIAWFIVFISLDKETPEQKQERTARLNQAIPLAGNTGVSQQWYDTVGSYLHDLLLGICVAVGTLLAHSIYTSYPNSVWQHSTFLEETVWGYMLANFSHKTLFVYVLWGLDFVAFWALSGIYAYLDFTRPAFLLPFKIQENVKISPERYLSAVKVALRNQAIALVLMHFLWEVYPLLAPTGFSAELPSFATLVFSLLAFIPLDEMWFYSVHYLMHRNTWLYTHVHYVHHTWHSPVAISTIYVHWAEHIMLNLPSLIIGPFMLGSHVTIWYIYMVGSILKRVLAHTGWHFPFFYPADVHDYHHFLGYDNFGATRIFDAFFGTDSIFMSQWQSKVAKRYFNQDYPVDKILAANNQAMKKQAEKKQAEQTTAGLNNGEDEC